MSAILIIYSTTDGHTVKICEHLKQVVEQEGHHVELVAVENVGKLELNAYDKIVIGASIRYGKHSRDVHIFIEQQQRMLESKPNAFFSVNLVARKPEKRTPETNPYVKKFLSTIRWQPQQVEVFAGKINYPIYSLRDRLIIQLIMWITKGPTDPATVREFTDWDQVSEFGKRISQL